MTRDEVISRVAAQIPALLADAGISVSDTAGNMLEVVDAALWALGYAADEAALVEDPVGFVAMTKYHALLAIEGRLAVNFDVSTASGSYRLQQVVAAVQKMIERSERELVVLFGSASPRGTMVKTYDLAFLTPKEAPL